MVAKLQNRWKQTVSAHSNWLWPFNRERKHSIKEFYAEHQYYLLFEVDGCQQVITVLISCSLLYVVFQKGLPLTDRHMVYWLTIP